MCPSNTVDVPPACEDSCSGVLLSDLEDVDVQLRTVNISSLVVASYLQLAELENRSREVQVSREALVTAAPPPAGGAAAVTCWCLLQVLVAGNTAASEQLSTLDELLGAVSATLGVLQQQVGQL